MTRDPEKYPAFNVVKEIDFDWLVSHLEEGMKTGGLFSAIYYLTFYALIGLLTFQLYQVFFDTTSISNEIIKISIGVLLGLLSIIPHELIHAMIYKLFGASNIQFKSNWKKMYFTTAVHKYILSKPEFIVLAMAPFVLIYILALFLAWSTQLYSTILPFLMIHTSLCKGDFSLINYINNARPNIECVFSDLEERKIYLLG